MHKILIKSWPIGLQLIFAAILLLSTTQAALAVNIIAPWEIPNIEDAVLTGSGNGTLDWRLISGSQNEIDNADSTSGFNADNATNNLASSGWVASNVTSGADLKAFYTLNFGYTDVGQTLIVVYLDLNETGAATGAATNTLDKFDIVLNPTIPSLTTDPYLGDVTRAEQNAIAQNYTGGTLITTLYAEPFDNLPINAQGAGFADYVVQTGIDPFTLADDDIVLFNISMSNLDNGSEEWFLSGTYAYNDIPPDLFTPEPATGLLVGGGLVAMFFRRRKQLLNS